MNSLSVPEPHPSRVTPRQRRNLRLPVRLAGFILLFVWIGPVTYLQNDTSQLLKYLGSPTPVAADSRIVPGGKALVVETNTLVKLHMRDGRTIKGRFLGRTLLDSTAYVERFATAAALKFAYVPFVLGESVHVALEDGREWTGPFAGYAELSLLVTGSDGRAIRVPFESAKEFGRATGERVAPRTLAAAFRTGKLPSAEALVIGDAVSLGNVMEQWDHGLRVAMDDIESATADLQRGMSTTGTVLLTVVVTTVIVLLVIGIALDNAFNDNCGGGIDLGPGFGGFSVTMRDFDRDRGCYVGDPQAIADAWPAVPPAERATPLPRLLAPAP